jgi:hypothetical protein
LRANGNVEFFCSARDGKPLTAEVHRFYLFSQAVGAGKIFAQLHQSCRWLGGIFQVDKQSISSVAFMI